MFKVGTVNHYFDKLGVAITKLDNDLSVGDKVFFKKNGSDLFSQYIESIQVEHQKLDSASRGDIIGLKTTEKVTVGTEIFKI